MGEREAHLQRSVIEFVRTDFPRLRAEMQVAEALTLIRKTGLGERTIYFYVVDDQDKLLGVLPVRRLLTAELATPLESLMIRRVVAIPERATLLDACDLFVLHQFFALPVVDRNRHIVGVIDIGVFTQQILDIEEPERTGELFEALGFHLSQLRGASPWKSFQVRFPWLLATIASGTGGAFLAGVFEATLERAIVVAFFLALVLALAESVSVQSMTLTLQALRTTRPTWRWFGRTLRSEMLSGVLIGLGCGIVVATIVELWRRQPLAAAVLGGSVAGAVLIASTSGVTIPFVLHALKLDPKIAAGPITLAVTDILTLLLYFSLASWFL